MKPLRAALAAFVLITAPVMAPATEEPAYEVLQHYEDFEVRRYAPYVVAEVVVPGPADEAGNQGFRILAGYIFGANRGERKIAMTAPVTQAATPQKIETTAPVTQAPAEDGHAVRFMMPREFTLETLPEPVDPRVRLKAVAGDRFAVIRYSGSWSQANYQAHLDRLRQAVEAAGLRSTGSPVYARYDAPWVPRFMRRNEVWLPLD